MYKNGDAHTLDAPEGEHDPDGPFFGAPALDAEITSPSDDRTAVKERDAENIIDALETFRDERDAPLPSADAVREYS